MESKKDRQKRLLGMPFGTASARLKKALMFDLARRANLLICHRCERPINSAEELSVEHKQAWESADDPAATFFELSNIGFSHLKCNVGAASRPNKKYADKREYNRINFNKYYARHAVQWNERRNARRRKENIRV